VRGGNDKRGQYFPVLLKTVRDRNTGRGGLRHSDTLTIGIYIYVLLCAAQTGYLDDRRGIKTMLLRDKETELTRM